MSEPLGRIQDLVAQTGFIREQRYRSRDRGYKSGHRRGIGSPYLSPSLAEVGERSTGEKEKLSMEKWHVKRILILGTTYPSYSRKYTELACTGGIFEETLGMVRLHPVPHRYLDATSRFKAFQWIRVTITKHISDPRPESYRIKSESIVLEDCIPPTKPEERLRYIEKSPNLCRSLEELKERQQLDGTSLGIIKPKEIINCTIKARSAGDRDEWHEKEKEILDQRRLFGDDLKPIDFPDMRFKVTWKCDDPRCQAHTMNLLQWGIHELNRKLRFDPEREQKLIDAMKEQLDQAERDIYLFVGNFRGVQYNFGLMGSYSAPRKRQISLFNT